MKTKLIVCASLLIGVATATISVALAGPGDTNPDPVRGGLLWDKWWAVNGANEPTGDHLLYPPAGQKSGPTTFRCKECHGWDYKGAAGAYGSGSHFTGIRGVYGSKKSAEQMFDLIKLGEGEVANGHGFGALGMSDEDLHDVVAFVQTLVIDTDLYIMPDASFVGDSTQGEINYMTGGIYQCVVCHGSSGTDINFGGDCDPEWIGTIAAGNPWEFLHKGRFGQPGTGMPSWLENGGADQGVADIGRYAQLAFPTTTCSGDTDRNGVVNFDDLLNVLYDWGTCQ